MAKLTKDYVDKWYDYDIDIDNRTLWLGSTNVTEDEESGVDAKLSERVIKGLHVLEKNAPAGDKEIQIIMNNPGGDVTEGLAIYDAIKQCKNRVIITVYGKCYSMASYILQAADHRIMSKHSSLMIHEGTRGLDESHPRTVKAWAKFCDYLDNICFDILLIKIRLKNPNFSSKKLEDMLKFDTILSADEALELGLVDEVLQNHE